MSIKVPEINLENPKPVEEMDTRAINEELEARGFTKPKRWPFFGTKQRQAYLKQVREGSIEKERKPALSAETVAFLAPGFDQEAIAKEIRKKTDKIIK